jgi:hypothetical protein
VTGDYSASNVFADNKSLEMVRTVLEDPAEDKRELSKAVLDIPLFGSDQSPCIF